MLQNAGNDPEIGIREVRIAPSKCPSHIPCTGTANSHPTPLKHSPCAAFLLGAKSAQCLSSRAHFARFVSNVSAPVLSLTLSLQLRLTIIIIIIIIIAHFLCRGRFLPMSQLPCSFRLISLECLSSRAQAQAAAQAQHHHHHHRGTGGCK